MDSIPINSLARHIAPLQPALESVAAQVIRSGHYVLGAQVAAFERAFAEYCGVAHCIGVANGTDALELSLRAVGVEPGDRVAVVANAAMYGTSAVLACGGVAVTTRALATWLGARMRDGRDVALLIGGPDGFAPEVLARAACKWALSKLTFPHALVRVILAEQLYRAHSVLINHPYHRE